MSITINADDFGIDRGTSEFIKTCIKKGYVNTTTVLINMEDYKETYELIKRADLIERVGLHLNLTEGRPISDGISRCFSFCKDGKFGQYKKHKYKRFFLSEKEKQFVEEEIEQQILRYLSVGYQGKWIDSHQGIHMDFSIFPIVMKYAKKYGFTKVRRSPNMNQTVYKKIFRIPFDCALKNSGFQTTEYFGNLIDIKPHLETLEKLDSVEIMTHPKNIDGIEYIDFYSDLKLQDWESIIMEITTERQ